MFGKIVEGRLFRGIDEKIYKLVVKLIGKIHKGFQKLCGFFDRCLCSIARRILNKTIKINPKQIMFLTYQGGYTCNPKAVAEEMIKQKLPYKMIWVVKSNEPKEGFPPELTLVNRGSYEFYKYAASSKVFVDNTHDLPRLGVRKKKGQIILQTWHGSLGIKRLDGNVVMNKRWKYLAKRCQEDTDYCISNSTFENEVFETSYWKGVPSLMYGHARNDILFSDAEKINEIKDKVYEELGIPKGKKMLLYAPTHRDNVGEHLFGLDYQAVADSMAKKFGGEWVVAIRLHNRMKKKAKQWIGAAEGPIIDATSYPDMQDVMIAADAGITDYSSWIFDYVLLGRPGFILADDLAEFEKSRDFYYPLQETPFPISVDNETLIKAIDDFNQEQYAIDLKKFLEERGCMEDGHASERIVEKIKEFMK